MHEKAQVYATGLQTKLDTALVTQLHYSTLKTPIIVRAVDIVDSEKKLLSTAEKKTQVVFSIPLHLSKLEVRCDIQGVSRPTFFQ